MTVTTLLRRSLTLGWVRPVRAEPQHCPLMNSTLRAAPAPEHDASWATAAEQRARSSSDNDGAMAGGARVPRPPGWRRRQAEKLI